MRLSLTAELRSAVKAEKQVKRQIAKGKWQSGGSFS
jgi:hypothetical protein